MNKYPLWKNALLIILLLIAVVYAIPNLFGKDPAIQISSSTPGLALDESNVQQVKTILDAHHLVYRSAILQQKNILVRFSDTDTQLQANTVLRDELGSPYIVAVTLESATPSALMALGAQPMKLGLDLQGGVDLLLQVDTDSIVEKQAQNAVRSIGDELRQAKVRYTGIAAKGNTGIGIRLATLDDVRNAQDVLNNRFPNYTWTKNFNQDPLQLAGALSLSAAQSTTQSTMDQMMNTFRRRVNELGVSEAVVQQQGPDRISVDLPGVQDAAQAQDIIGKTANLEFHLVDSKADAGDAVSGLMPVGDELFNYNGAPVLLTNRILLAGDSIVDASTSFDESGRPAVSIRVGGSDVTLFSRVTGNNIGQPMAVVYVETKPQQDTGVDGKPVITYKQERRVINVATIQSALGESFQVTGLSSPDEAKNLALLLRAGTLAAPVAMIAERTIGPSLGQQNIHLGTISMEIGMLFIVLFMLFYYRLFGLVAGLGLLVNLIFLTAILSVIGATLTVAGLAGIVLTAGMAIDYNVLIYERIREEIRSGITPQPAIHAGYDKAFATIIDANVTTLIVGLILFALGSGAVKGFAITLTIGLFTSIVSSVTYTRMLVNWIYGAKKVKALSIGINPPQKTSFQPQKVQG